MNIFMLGIVGGSVGRMEGSACLLAAALLLCRSVFAAGEASWPGCPLHVVCVCIYSVATLCADADACQCSRRLSSSVAD